MANHKGFAQEMRPMTGADTPTRSCKWLEGEPREFNYCGEPTKAGQSFCPAHRARVYEKPSKQRREQFRFKQLFGKGSGKKNDPLCAPKPGDG